VTVRPKIAYVVKRYPRFSETFIVNEILAHEAAGWELEIFSLRPPEDTHFQNAISRVRAPVTYLRTEGLQLDDFWALAARVEREMPGAWSVMGEGLAGGASIRDVCKAVFLAQAARARGLAHLHAHFATSAATVARLAAKLTGLPFTFTAHAKDIFHESVDPADLRAKLRDAAAVVTVSDFNVAHLRETFGADAARVRRVFNGLDLALFPYAAPVERPPRIVAVGRLVEKKGFGDLVEACALLAARGCRFEALIVGSGEEEAALRAKIERTGLQGRVVMAGPRPQSEIIHLVQESAVMAAPCVVGRDGNRDGLPTVLLESMALGTPVVSTAVTGIPEVVRDGETGLLVAESSPAELADALERLLDDAALRVRLATGARRLIEEQFDVHANAAELGAIFLAAADAGRSAR